MIIEEKDLALTRCRALIEKKLQWGSSNDWVTQDFERLSEQIAHQTGTTLSTTTLKRVWGKVKYDSVPTQTTLNTLAQFLGYDNWRFFCMSEVILNGNGKYIITKPIVAETFPKISTWQKYKAVILGIMVLSITTSLTFLFWNNTNLPLDTSQVSFSSKKVSEELPNSVLFDYNIGSIRTDSVTIQQSWDPRRRERISAHKQQHTSIYYYPGYFRAKLLVNNQIMKEHDIFIKTQGWKGIIEQKPHPIYLSAKEINLEESGMEIKAETLRKKIGKSVFNDVWTNFYWIDDFNLKADNFTFETMLQNTSTKEEAICQKVRIRILTSESAIGLPLCSKGCISDASIFIGGKSVSGKDHDLSAFGCDFSAPQHLVCHVKNKTLTVFLNGNTIFTAPSEANLGKIVGMVISFEGTGKVQKVVLK